MIHKNIQPFKTHIEKKFLYDMDERYSEQYVPATVFGISSYSGETLTLQTLLDDGSLFSYMPMHALRANSDERKSMQGSTRESRLELSDLVYKNCPGKNITVTKYDYLDGTVDCYFRKKELWLSGEYMFTIDWYDDNEQFHMISLENGQYAVLPNHKIKFKSGIRSFEPYKKIHNTWKV